VSHGPLEAVVQVVVGACLLALLVGRPGGLRTLVGAIPATLLLLVGIVATVVSPRGGAVEKDAVAELTGSRFRWYLTLPPGRCHARPAEAAARMNPAADRMAFCPDDRAEIIVIAEELPSGRSVDLDRFVDVVVESARRDVPDLEVVSSEPHPERPDGARVLQTRGSVLGVRWRWVYGLYADGPRLVQAIAQVPERSFEGSRDELVRSVSSLKL
jgi:hypothetical protein